MTDSFIVESGVVSVEVAQASVISVEVQSLPAVDAVLVQGPQGLTGPVGPAPEIRVQMLAGNGTAAGIPINSWEGEWDNFTYYTVGDVVSLAGSTYILISLGGWTVGGAPPGYGWELFTTVDFQLDTPAMSNSSVQVFRNGLAEIAGVGFTASSDGDDTVVSFSTAPLADDEVQVVYQV